MLFPAPPKTSSTAATNRGSAHYPAPADLQRFDEPEAYNRCWQQAFNLLSDELNTDRFRENLRKFYRGEYTFP